VGQANRIVLLTDPQASSSDATLLEHALVEVLRENDHEVAHLTHRSGSRRARALRLLAQAKTLGRTARAQYDRLELDSALTKYNKVLAKLDRVVAMSDDLRPLKDTLMMLAATCILVGQERRARDLLERLLVLDPSATVDDTVFNPRMMAVFHAVASRVRGGASFDLEVHVDPPGAAVVFDGKLVGLAPVTVPTIQPGRHYITASLNGFETTGRAVDIRAHSGHSVALQLTKTPPDSRLHESSSIAVSAIDDPELPPGAKALAATAGADTVLLLAKTPTAFKLIRYSADGSHRAEHSISEKIRNADSARALAHALLGPLAGGAGPQTDSWVAAEPARNGLGGTDVAREGQQRATEPAGDDPGATHVPREGRDRTRAPAGPDITSLQQDGGEEDRDHQVNHGLFSDNPRKNATLWISYGSAVAVAGIGAVFGYLALDAKNQYDLKTTTHDDVLNHAETTDQRESVPIKEAGERNALIADTMYGTAAALVAVGICLHLFWHPSAMPSGRMESDSGLSWTVGPNFLRLTY
jgi:hypothetical protein